MIKRDSELLTRAQLIRNEVATGNNTAERVGEHLEDMVDRLGKADIKQPDSSAPYKAVRPTVTFKFDDGVGTINDWVTHFNTYREGTVGSLAIVSSWVKGATPLYTADTIAFVPDNDGDHDYEELTDSAEGFVAAGIEPGMVIHVTGTTNHNANGHFWVVDTVEAGSIVMRPQYDAINDNYASSGYAYGDLAMVAESAGTSFSIYQGRKNAATWAEIKTAVDAGWEILSHSKTHRAFVAARGFPEPSGAELWEETYTAKAELEAGLAAAGATQTEVKHLVIPFGVNSDTAKRIIRQAGYESANSSTYGIEVNSPIIDPLSCEEENSYIIANTDNALAETGSGSTTAITTSGDLTGSLSAGDIILIWDDANSGTSNMAVREIANITSDTITLDAAPAAEFTAASIYLCSTEAKADNSLIGFVNEINDNGGWLQVGAHINYGSQDAFNQSRFAAVLDYVDYLNDGGADIQIETRGDAWDIFEPLLQAGHNFAVSADGVMIRNAKSQSLTFGGTQTKLGYNAGMNDNGTTNVYLGYGATARNNTDHTTAIGYQSTYQASGTSPSYCTLLGYRAGYTNSGANVVAIGDRAAYGNTESDLLIIGSRGANSYSTPLIKGYFQHGGIVLGAPSTTNKVDDANIPANRFTFYLDEATHKLHVRVCYANGTTYKTGEVALT